jgi:hypothetical protein
MHPNKFNAQSVEWVSRYNGNYWSWYWLTAKHAEREKFITEVGENIILLPIHKAGGSAGVPKDDGKKDNPMKSNCRAAAKASH